MAGRWVLAGCGSAVLAAGAAVSEMAGARSGVEAAFLALFHELRKLRSLEEERR